MVRELLVGSPKRRETFVTECKDGYSFGKLTTYDDGVSENLAFDDIMKIYRNEGFPYYSKNGKAITALNTDWKQYSTQLTGHDEPKSV